MFFPQIVRVCEALLADQDDMVQKGLGWLLREAAKADPKSCETLPAATRARVLSRNA